MTKKWILPLVAFLLCTAAGYRIRQNNVPSAGTAIAVPSQVVLTLVTDTTRDRPARLEEDGVFLMSANAWRRGLTVIKAKLSAELQSGGRVRCDDKVACEWLGQNVDATGPDDADVIVASAQYWSDEATSDPSESSVSHGINIVIPMTSKRKHGLVAGRITLGEVPLNLTSPNTRRDHLLASNDLDTFVMAPLTEKPSQILKITGQKPRNADLVAVDLEYSDALSVLQMLLKYGALLCMILQLFGSKTSVRLLLTCVSGIMLASASSMFTLTSVPNIGGLLIAGLVGIMFSIIGLRYGADNVAGILLGCLLADLLTGGYLGSFTGLGANPVVGARYYGLGNELSALLLGAASTLPTIKTSQRAIVVGFVALVIGHPGLGANGGDMVAVLIGILIFAALNGGKYAVLTACAVLTAVVAVVIWDAFFVPSTMQSHIGRLVASAGSGVYELISSKASAHIRLMSTSAWGITALLSLGWWVIRYRYRQGSKPDLGECLVLPLFVLNDSGPVSITLFTLVAMSCDNALAPKNSWSWLTNHAGALRHK